MRTVNEYLSRTRRSKLFTRVHEKLICPKTKPRALDPGFALKKFLHVSEVIVHAEAQEARVQSVVHAGDRVGAAREIHVKVLNLRRPILRKSVLQAGTGGPADKRLVLIEPQELAFELAIGKAGRTAAYC